MAHLRTIEPKPDIRLAGGVSIRGAYGTAAFIPWEEAEDLIRDLTGEFNRHLRGEKR
jgi:hypothetical protein